MADDIKKIKQAVKTQVSKTDKVIASNEAIADVISGLDNTLSEVHGTLSSGFSMLGAGLQELCFNIDDGFREVSYKLDLQNETLQAIKEILERPLDTQAKELRKRAEFAYLNGWMDEAEVDLLESEKKNYQDFIALHILGNIYYHHRKNHQKALEYYQKAAKYAAPQSKLDACKALLCTANVYKELGKAEDAYKSTRLAMDTLSDDAHNLFNHSAYSAMTKHSDESIDCLKRAVLKNPIYLIAADSDERFSDAKGKIKKLAVDLMDEERKTVTNILQRIESLLKEANTLETDAFKFLDKRLSEINNLLAEANVLCVRNSYFDILKAENVALTAEQMTQKTYDECKERLVFSDLCCLDKETKLMWTRDADIAGKKMNWDDACKFIEQLNEQRFAGYGDWRLSSKEELLTLINYAESQEYKEDFHELFNKVGFKNMMFNLTGFSEFAKSFWSSTTSGFFGRRAWRVWMGSGEVLPVDKTQCHWVLPVRAGQ